MNNIVEDPFIKQSRSKMDSFKRLLVTLEAVVAHLDTLKGLSQHPAPLSPAPETSGPQQIQNHNVVAVDLVDILTPQRPNSYLQCLKQGLAVTCKKNIKSVNCKCCLLAGETDDYSTQLPFNQWSKTVVFVAI